jgi:dTDP-4-dehydrorhamnose 3,5-epimerase
LQIRIAFVSLLEGINIYEIKRTLDERGFFSELFRNDWKDLLQGDEIVQTNLSTSHPGMIRAWHRHRRGQVDYFFVLKGALKICAYDETKGEIVEIIQSEDKPQIVRMPGHYWHGFKNIGGIKAILIYFVNRLYDYDNPDEERRPWNDETIIDKKAGEVFDWNRPPHK